MNTAILNIMLTAALLALTTEAAYSQQAFFPTGVQAQNILSGVYPGDTEGDCCWLSENAVLRISPAEDAKALLVKVFIPPFALSNGPQRLYVQIGANPEQATGPLSGGDHELVFQLPAASVAGQLDVRIRPAYTFVPAQLGMNQDPRHLSLLVRAVQFATDENGIPTDGTTLIPENAPPQIVDLSLDRTVVSSGDVVTGTVTTSSNVASVEARIANISMQVPKLSEGRFALHYTVPKLPRFLRHTYDLVVIARNAAGVTTRRVVPITIR